MLAQITAGQVDAVLAWHTDRLHRSVTELEEYATLCDQHSTATHTVKAGHLDLSTPSGRLVARLLGSVSRHEVEHMVERQQRAKLRSASAGKWQGGRRPFGYADNGVDVVADEAAAIREAATAVLAGQSLRGLAREWTAKGLVTSTGRPWDGNAVRRVLLRPRNAGLMQHQGQVVGPAEWPALIPEDQWRAVVTVITDPARTVTPGPARKWLGSGLYRCGVCDRTVIGTTAGKRRIYRCRAGHVTRNLAALDSFVESVIAGRLRRPDAADLLNSTASIDTSGLEQQAVTLRARLDQLAGLFAAGQVDARQLTEGTRGLRDQLDDIHERITDSYRGTAMAGLATAPDPGAAWLSADLDRKRAVLDALATITIEKGAGGRPHGWQAGESYFRHDLVRIEWRQS